MTIDDTTVDEERFRRLAREKQGFYKGQRGHYIGTVDPGDDTILLRYAYSVDMNKLDAALDLNELLKVARFGIYELGFPGLEVLDLAVIQLHDIIAGPFEDYREARNILPYVIDGRYRRKERT